MKAIIMAGGEGTRLRPLSFGVPKPMVPILEKPVLGYIIELLEFHGFTDACVTLRYMPEIVREYLEGVTSRVRVCTHIETTALGTAGGVRACREFLGNEPFLVISGDCVCDFDLSSLVRFHSSQNADVTIALTRSSEPLEYGLVLTDSGGRITSFQEKPAWENVLTDMVNTGIYVISPCCLDIIPENESYDFGRHFFPRLLSDGRRLFGYHAPGYWCDIGSPGAYLRCVYDILDGRVRLDIDAPSIGGGRIYSSSPIPSSVTVTAPIFIGSNVTFGHGSVIGPGSVIGNDTVIGVGAEIEGSVVSGSVVGPASVVMGSIVCPGSVLKSHSQLLCGSVVGSGVTVGENAVIGENVKIWPEVNVPDGFVARSNITSQTDCQTVYFSSAGVISSQFLTPDIGLRVGSALSRFRRIGISSSPDDRAGAVSLALETGALLSGAEVYRLDSALESAVSMAAELLLLRACVCVINVGGVLRLRFFGSNGSEFSRESEREIESALAGSIAISNEPGTRVLLCGVFELYVSGVARYAQCVGDLRGYSLKLQGSGQVFRALHRSLGILGCSESSDASVTVSVSGGVITLTDETGRTVPSDKLILLAALIELENGARAFTCPVSAPDAVYRLAMRYGAVVRPAKDGERPAMSLSDPVAGVLIVLSYLNRHNLRLADLALPEYTSVTREVSLRTDRGSVMSSLSSRCGAVPSHTGISISDSRGHVVVTPLRTHKALLIRTESHSAELASELAGDITELVTSLDLDE